MPERFYFLASNAFKPAGNIRSCSISSLTRLILTALQVLPGLRGVNRIMYRCRSMLFRIPSILSAASAPPRLKANPFGRGHVEYSDRLLGHQRFDQCTIVADCRGRQSGDLALIVPLPDAHSVLVKALGFELRHLMHRHRTAL